MVYYIIIYYKIFLGSDTETPVTPKLPARRTRKDSTSSLEQQSKYSQ